MIYHTIPEKNPQTPKDDKNKPASKTHPTNNLIRDNDDPSNNSLQHAGATAGGAHPVVPAPNATGGGAHPVVPPPNATPGVKLCHLCGKDDHIATKGPYGKKFVQYLACKVFVDASCSQRFALLKGKGFCTQCLFPGAYATAGKHVDGSCQSTYVCRHDSHNSFTVKKHILVCEEHKDEDSNKALLEEYRARCITRKCNQDLPEYSKTIQLSHFAPFQHTTQPLLAR